MYGVTNSFYNYTGSINCTDTTNSQGIDAVGLDCLLCNQMAIPTPKSKHSMFIETPNYYLDYGNSCKDNFGLVPWWAYALTNFGGGVDPVRDFQDYSNIIFSNGLLDPFSGGGMRSFLGANLPVFNITDGAVSLDMKAPRDEDKGTEVEYTRELESLFLEKWIREYQTPPTPGSDSEAKI